MTIPTTNASLADINGNLNRTLTSQVDFNSHVRLFNPIPFGQTGISDVRGRVGNYHCLIKCDGSNGSTAIGDITKTFNLGSLGTATISTAQSKFGGASLYTSNTGTSFSVNNNPSNVNLTSYSGNWTIEMFTYYVNGGSSTGGVSRFITGFAGNYDSSVRFGGTQLHAYYFEPPDNAFRSITYNLGTLPTNTWFHWAFVKSGTNLYLYYNGNQVGSTTCAGNAMAMNSFYVGNSGGEYFTGYLDEIRFSTFARYTGSTYTIPTASYDA
jgi:hypothetical protein